MDHQRVFTNLRCNQNCTYCNSRRTADDRAFVVPQAVRARIDAAVAGGASTIAFSGGEPALRRDIVELVAHARARGAKTVVLETNATPIDLGLATALRDAGLEIAQVNLSGWGEGLDAVTRDEGGFARTMAGIRALGRAGVRVEISAVLVRSTLPLLPALPTELAKALGDDSPVRAIVLTVPAASPEPGELVSYEEASETLLAVDAAAREAGIRVRLGPEPAVPPCVFPRRAKVAQFFSLTRGGATRRGYRKLAACGECQVADRCPGFSDEYLARHPSPTMHPVSDDKLRRRLSLKGTVEQQIDRELVTVSRCKDPIHGSYEEHVIRIHFHCNQSCRFCFVSTHLPPAHDDAVRAAILAAASTRAKIVLSGGEPTLNAKLLDYVRLAKASTEMPVVIQTNAIKLDDAELAQSLADAGIDEAFVSLHASTADISDAITEAPGTFVRTLVGIDNLYRAGIALYLNFVICEKNFRTLPEYVRFVAERWPKAYLSISFVAASTDVVPRDKDLVPRYSEVLPYLTEAIAEGERLGLTIGGFHSMCGIPLCLVPVALDRYFSLGEIPDGFDQGEFAKTEVCRSCALEPRCYGIRRGYAELHGTGELRAVAPSSEPVAGDDPAGLVM